MRVAISTLGFLVIASVALQVEAQLRSDQIRFELIADLDARRGLRNGEVLRLDNRAYIDDQDNPGTQIANPKFLWTRERLPDPAPALQAGERRVTAVGWNGRNPDPRTLHHQRTVNGWPNNHGNGDATGRIVWSTTTANRNTWGPSRNNRDLHFITMHIPDGLITEAERLARNDKWPTRGTYVAPDPYGYGLPLTIIPDIQVPVTLDHATGRAPTIRLREVQAAFPRNPNDPRIAVGQRVYFKVHYTVPQMRDNGRNNDPTHLTVNLEFP